jgi:hypothetical protein
MCCGQEKDTCSGKERFLKNKVRIKINIEGNICWGGKEEPRGKNVVVNTLA